MKGTSAALCIALATASLDAAADAGHGSFGRPGDPTKASRTIAIDASDAMRFTPARIAVKRGETVRFVVRNTGRVAHEMVLGSMAELKEHAALMRRFPSMEHDEPSQARVEPGKSAEIVWQFTRAGEVSFACLVPGHMEAGMLGQVRVTK